MRTFRQILESYVEDNVGNEATDDASRIDPSVNYARLRVKDVVGSEEPYGASNPMLGSGAFPSEMSHTVGKVYSFSRASGDWWRMLNGIDGGLGGGSYFFHESWLEQVE